MLFIHTSIKDELECFPSGLIYGQSLRLSQEFSFIPTTNLMNKNQLVANVHDLGKNLQTPAPCAHHAKFFVNKNLDKCKRVFIRNNHMQQSLSPRYNGPYDVILGHKKIFCFRA